MHEFNSSNHSPSLAMHSAIYLLVSVPLPDIDTGQISHNESPQLLVGGELKGDTKM